MMGFGKWSSDDLGADWPVWSAVRFYAPTKQDGAV